MGRGSGDESQRGECGLKQDVEKVLLFTLFFPCVALLYFPQTITHYTRTEIDARYFAKLGARFIKKMDHKSPNILRGGRSKWNFVVLKT